MFTKRNLRTSVNPCQTASDLRMNLFRCSELQCVNITVKMMWHSSRVVYL